MTGGLNSKKIKIICEIWLILIIGALIIGKKAYSCVYIPGVDIIEIGAVWYGDSSTLFSCLNEVVQQEEWSSIGLETDQNTFCLPINPNVEWKSALWKFVPQELGSSLTVSDIRLMCGDKCIEEFKGEDLVKLFNNTNCSNLTLIKTDDEIKIKISQKNDSAYLRFSPETVQMVEGLIENWKEEELVIMQERIIISFIQGTVVALLLSFWGVYFFDKSWLQCFFNHAKKKRGTVKQQHFEWIDCMRGMAIIAVVVCHQQHFLHDTEWLQMISLYSVTTFIFCMGITRWLSLEAVCYAPISYNYWQYMWRSLKGILSTYFVATICYLSISGSWSWGTLFLALINFSASGPFYFMQYVILFCAISPFLYAFIKKILCLTKNKGILLFMFCLTILILGYNLPFLGSTYLLVYAMGMIFCGLGFPDRKMKTYLVSVVSMVIGSITIYDIYFGNDVLLGGVNSLISNVEINPPNFSVLLYAFGCILLFYSCFASSLMENKFGSACKQVLSILGRYSMDIFIWHLLIQRYFIIHPIRNIWARRIVVYLFMFGLPIILRIFWNELKEILKKEKILWK